MAPSLSKKRKRDTEPDSEETSLQLSTADATQVGPVLVSFPALQPSKSTAFKCYSRKGKPADDEPFVSQDTFVVGETDAIELVSSSESRAAAAGCSYLVGIHDKRTNTTTLRPAPLHILTRHVKKLKGLKPMEVSVEERMKLRNTLGETFGTKKAKAAIRAAERNRVDVDAMEGVAGHLQSRIAQNTESLPTQEEAKATADESRLIPPYNADAQRPEDVYALHDIIPEAEFNALSIHAIKAASGNKERRALLPFNRSNWVNQHLNLAFQGEKPKKSDLKILLYISALIAFRSTSRILNDRQAVHDRLKGVPSIIVDGMLSRFTETSRDKNEAKMTPQTEVRLLTHMFALCLKIDDFATDTTLISKDLSMAITKINNLFKSLGCKVETLSQQELKRLGLPDSAALTKRAVLRIPFEFPKARMKRARR